MVYSVSWALMKISPIFQKKKVKIVKEKISKSEKKKLIKIAKQLGRLTEADQVYIMSEERTRAEIDRRMVDIRNRID